jgi:tetratricopeptide (TPR) repeat protein
MSAKRVDTGRQIRYPLLMTGLDSTTKKSFFYAAAVAVFVFAFLLSANTLQNGLMMDDVPQILSNRYIDDIKYLSIIFANSAWVASDMEGVNISNYYRPVPNAMHLFTYLAAGPTPWVFHLVSVMVHALNSLLVFVASVAVFDRIRDAGAPRPYPLYALLAALIFASHPIHVEAVAYVASIYALTYSFFCLLAFYLYLKERLVASAFACFLGLLCKEPAITLLPLVVIFDFVVLRRAFTARRIKRYIPLAIASAVFLIVRSHVLGGMVRSLDTSISTFNALTASFPLFLKYMGKLILPTGLTPFLAFNPFYPSPFDAAIMASIALTVGLGALVWVLGRRSGLFIFFAAAVVLPLLPVLYIPAMVLNPHIYADNQAYLSVWGFGLFAVCGAGVVVERAGKGAIRALVAAFLVLIAAYSVQTLRENRTWKDLPTLLDSAIQKDPSNFFAHYQRGLYLSSIGRTGEAVAEIDEAIRLNAESKRPHVKTRIDMHLTLFEAYRTSGRPDLALRELEKVFALDPDNQFANYNMGILRHEAGDLERALGYYAKALERMEHKFDRKDIYNNVGNILTVMGRYDEAIRSYESGLALDPNDERLRRNRDVALGRKRLSSENSPLYERGR